MALPPPTATTTSAPDSRHRVSASSTASGDGKGGVSSNSVMRERPMSLMMRCSMPRARRLWRPVTRNTRELVPATPSTTVLRSASLPLPNMTLVVFSQVKVWSP